MEKAYHSHWSWLEKISVALMLLALSALLYYLVYLILGDSRVIGSYFLIHFAFLPIHALVLGIILEEVLNWRERRSRQRKLNFFMGIFFRQMGVDLYVHMVELVENRDQLEELTMVQPHWTPRRFRAARQALRAFPLRVRSDVQTLKLLFELLEQREQEILELTRNPSLWEYERLYRVLVALFHLVEERRFLGQLDSIPPPALEHLARDVGKALLFLLRLWLAYLEFLKSEHPVLFKHQMGVHNTVQPLVMEEELD